MPLRHSLPSYTNVPYCVPKCIARQIRKQNIIKEVYNVDDVINMEPIDSTHIKGIGECHGVKFILKQKERYIDQGNIPNAGLAVFKRERLEWENIVNDDSKEVKNGYFMVQFVMPKRIPNKIWHASRAILFQVHLPPLPNMFITHLTPLVSTLGHSSFEDIFINGFQSWSFAGTVRKPTCQPGSAIPAMFSAAFNQGGTSPNNHHYLSDFFTMIKSQSTALVLGWLSQRKQFGVIGANANLTHLEMHCNVDAVAVSPLCSDWGYCEIIVDTLEEEPLRSYVELVGKYNDALKPKSNIVGWCSWYHFFRSVTSENLKKNVAKMATMKNTVPWNLCIVDDGYMMEWGDWTSLKPSGFPEGNELKSVSEDIVAKEIEMPGLWLAPYVADFGSQITDKNKSWIIRNDLGRVANSGFSYKFFYGLDASNPEVRKYAHDITKLATEKWGYKFLKFDFLYGCCLQGNGIYDMTMTRAEVMDLALRTLRHAAGKDAFLMGCGCPLGSAIGLMNSVRISADTNPTWYPEFPLPWWDAANLPACRSMIRNTINRSSLGYRWWMNDPDCLLLGETNLTTNEIVSTASVIAMTGSDMLILSADLSKVSQDRFTILQKIIPGTGYSAISISGQAIDFPNILYLKCSSSSEKLQKQNYSQRELHINVEGLQKTWTLISLSNWMNRSVSVRVNLLPLLPKDGENGYHILAFWSCRYVYLPSAEIENVSQYELSKFLGVHQTEIFVIRPVEKGPHYIGSNLHFTCGLEVKSVRKMENGLEVILKNDYERSGSLFLYLPGKIDAAFSCEIGSGLSCEAKIVGVVGKLGRVLQVPVHFPKGGSAQVKLKF